MDVSGRVVDQRTHPSTSDLRARRFMTMHVDHLEFNDRMSVAHDARIARACACRWPSPSAFPTPTRPHKRLASHARLSVLAGPSPLGTRTRPDRESVGSSSAHHGDNMALGPLAWQPTVRVVGSLDRRNCPTSRRGLLDARSQLVPRDKFADAGNSRLGMVTPGRRRSTTRVAIAMRGARSTCGRRPAHGLISL